MNEGEKRLGGMVFNRRTFLATAAAALLTGGRARGALPDAIIPLWPGEPPGGGGPTGPLAMSPRGSTSAIAAPSVQVFAPQRPNGSAMIVAPGGGYKRISLQNEGISPALWLAQRGITTYVLSYRLPREGWRAGRLAPLQDAQRAICIVRRGIGDFRPQRLGVLGFSAGGHLMGLAAMRHDFASYQPVDGADREPARTDAAALIYPIVTLEPPFDSTSSRVEMIGQSPPLQLADAWSVDTYVRAGCPPVFLVDAKDDTIANPQHSRILADACRKAGVPVALHELPSGGHGFGMGKSGTPSQAWPNWFEAWLREVDLL
ncbi:alpha/beta hydrolase [Rhodomicrobium lacus]|uniref:alpha/beta hydrolase n=1 Tax=Rhodomicrobium lacus TaxID=2498452 RepID=UPI0026E35468|nr:alpha/beta hydrolase [Rhodomicrobium lacus]WKW52163.1 alpha/beta hydrolase [Rhodomicrobium lacus]